MSAREALERAESGGGSRPLGLRSLPRLVSVAVLAVVLIVLVGVVVGIVAGHTPSAQPNRNLGHEAGSVPAVRIGLVAMSFTDAQLGYGVYEPFNPGAAIPPPRLVRTSDGGADWFVVGPTPPAPPSDSVGQIHLVFESQEVGFFWAGGSLYETTDGGRHWHAELPGDAISVSVADGAAWAEVRDHCGGASACGQTVYVSPANGSGWQAARHFGTGSSVDGPVAAVSSSTVYVPFTSCSGACSASRAHVEATTDGGRSWTTKALACAGQPREGSPTLSASPDGALFVVCYRSPKEGVSASAVYRSLDGGDTWQLESSFSVNERLPRGLRAGRLSVLTPTSADDAYVITDEDGGPRVEITTDGGKTWAEPASDPRVHVDGGAFATTGTSVAFLAGYGEGIWATDDGGSTWTLDPALSAAYATTAEVHSWLSWNDWFGASSTTRARAT